MPDAPPPIYNSAGQLIEPWKVTIEYDAVADRYRVTRSSMVFARGGWRSSSKEWPVGSIEDALAAVQASARTMSARRLF